MHLCIIIDNQDGPWTEHNGAILTIFGMFLDYQKPINTIFQHEKSIEILNQVIFYSVLDKFNFI